MRRAALVLALLSWSPSPAAAHVGHVIRTAERYLKLDVDGYRARVVVSLTLGAAEGRRVLEAADADGDGAVSEAESDAYLAQWGEGLSEEVPLRLDGEPVVAPWGEGYLAPIGQVRGVPVTVEMVARFELGGGEQTIVLEDRMVRREVFERTDVRFQIRGDAELVRSGVEGDDADPTEELAYGGSFRDGDPVPLVAVIRTPERETAWPWWYVAAPVAVLLALAAALVWARRRGSS